MTISEKVAWLKGLAEGVELENQKTKEAKVLTAVIGVLEEISLSIEDLEESSRALGEEVNVLSDDLADLENEVYDLDDEEEDEDELDLLDFDPEEDALVVACPSCNAPIEIDDEGFTSGEVVCPECGTRFALHIPEASEEEEEE